ncbi:hypothetical protein DW272_01675 [Blautia obeum]|uniref:Uncharacterized protein n=1 Tax=Blautia obeum TaxID=40520 RepID=A0A414SK33_9FIRM|nr:hypothetical protein [Blautia obeum]RHG19942.1 hypothetical protein DW272_01675 [Blautia obeum]
MGIILPQKIKVFCDGNVVKYYENLGYQIPKYYNQRRKKYAVKRGTTIEGFYKNNIDWKKVQKIGELDYTKDVIRDFSRGAA